MTKQIIAKLAMTFKADYSALFFFIFFKKNS